MTTQKCSKSSHTQEPSSSPALTKFQAFTVERISRGQITGAKYNPRTISPAAKSKLKKLLKKWGLLEPVIVNRRTMNLVGGHQRLACLDALEGSQGYLLDVSMVSLTDKEEREANVMLNNLELQGEWDLKLLADLLPEVSLEDVGFEQTTLDVIFDGTEYAPMFSVEAQAPQAQDALAELQAMAAQKDEEKPADAQPNDGDVKRKASAEAVAEMRKSSKGMSIHEDTERFAVVIFNSRKDRDAWIEGLGLEPGTRYVLGDQIVCHRK